MGFGFTNAELVDCRLRCRFGNVAGRFDGVFELGTGGV